MTRTWAKKEKRNTKKTHEGPFRRICPQPRFHDGPGRAAKRLPRRHDQWMWPRCSCLTYYFPQTRNGYGETFDRSRYFGFLTRARYRQQRKRPLDAAVRLLLSGLTEPARRREGLRDLSMVLCDKRSSYSLTAHPLEARAPQ